ncbi:hypothetical protein MHYP_G00130250 [Metynnis hypsauchen]
MALTITAPSGGPDSVMLCVGVEDSEAFSRTVNLGAVPVRLKRRVWVGSGPSPDVACGVTQPQLRGSSRGAVDLLKP